jgi:hypothetical protein
MQQNNTYKLIDTIGDYIMYRSHNIIILILNFFGLSPKSLNILLMILYSGESAV